jgi:hypothetical protein
MKDSSPRRLQEFALIQFSAQINSRERITNWETGEEEGGGGGNSPFVLMGPPFTPSVPFSIIHSAMIASPR